MKQIYHIFFLCWSFLLLVLPPSWGQAPDFAWARQAQGTNLDNSEAGWAVARDNAGNSYVIGTFSYNIVFGSTTLTSNGGSSFVVKYDASGNILWAKKIADNTAGRGIAVDGSGNSYVTGYFYNSASFGSTTLTTSGNNDVFVAKYDASGNLVWAKKAGGTSTDEGYGIAVDTNGNSYITGYFYSSATFGSTTLTSSGISDMFIAKCDASGNFLWARKGGGNSFDYGYAIAADAAGNTCVTGYFNATATFGTTSITSAGTSDVYIARYDASGNLAWVRRAGGANSDQAYGVAMDGSGNSYVTGFFWDTATFGSINLTSGGAGDVFVVKYNAAGTFQWVQRSAGTGNDRPTAIAVDGSGNSYATGYFTGTSTFGSTTLTANGNDSYIIKLNTSGAFQWVQKAGGAGDDIGRGIAVDGSGNAFVTGNFQNDLAFGNITVNSNGGTDMFLAKYNTSGTALWAKSQYGYSVNDIGHAIARDASGNSYVTGFFSGNAVFGTTNLTGSGGSNVFVAKYDPSGNLLWVKRGGGTGVDIGRGIAVDASGNSYVIGYFSGTATFGSTTLTSSGNSDVFVAKYDANGNLLWVRKTGGGTEWDYGTAIALDGSGNSYITGYFSGNATFGSSSFTSRGSNDIFIAKYDAAGTLQWARQGGGTGEDNGTGIGVDGAGNCYMTGFFYSSATFSGTTLTGTGSFNTDMCLVKYDPSGNVIWVRKGGGFGSDYAQAVAVDGAGNCYVTGNFSANATFGSATVTNSGSDDVFIVKFDAAGNVLWAQKSGGANYDQGYGVAFDGSGNSYVTGQFQGNATFGSTTLTSSGSFDAFVAKFDATGNALWAVKTGSANDDRGAGIAADGAGKVNVTGYFTGSASFGNITLESGGTELFVAQLAAVTGITTGTISPTQFCQEATFNVPFTISGTFNSGNAFEVELSDELGSFASPYYIGYLSGTSSGTIPVTLPAGLPAGTAYRVRVVANAPAVVGTDNGNNLTISSQVTPSVTASALPQSFKQGGTVTLSVPSPEPGTTYSWVGPNLNKATGTSVTATPSSTGTKTYTVTASNGSCQASAAVKVYVQATSTPDWAWGTRSTGGSDIRGYSIATDGAGNSYVTGNFNSTGTFGSYSLTSSGSTDIVVLKLDAAGNVLWAQKAGGSGSDNGRGIAIDGSGNIFITGQFQGSATFGGTTLTSTGNLDVFVAKLDAAGNFLWVRGGGSSGNDAGFSIAVDATGNVLATGSIEGSATFSGTTLTGSGSRDAFIVKYNAAGTILWSRKVGGSGWDESRAIAVDGTGNSYITGAFEGTATFGSTTFTSSGNQDAFLVKIDGSGNIAWARKAGGVDTGNGDAGLAITVDNSGSSFITGRYVGPATFESATLSADGNTFITKYNSSGSLIWAREAKSRESKGIVLDQSGNLYLTGAFSGEADFGGIALVSAQANDVFVAKYNSSGNVIWAQNGGGSGFALPTAEGIGVDGTGNAYVTGHYLGTMTLGSITLPGSGGFSMFTGMLGVPPAPTIATGSISPLSMCAGAAVIVPFTTTGAFAAGNTFTAQLSNASGSFANPVAIGTLAGTNSGTIQATIPASAAAGTGYRIRVVASNPATTGTNNGVDLNIKEALGASAAANTGAICPGSPVRLAAYTGATGTATYCAPSVTNTPLSVQFGLNSQTLNPVPATQSYYNYTQTLAPIVLTENRVVPFDFSVEVPSPYYSYGDLRIFIDLDQDGVFDDFTEQMFSGQIPVYGAPYTFVNDNFIVPAGYNIVTRMRVQVDFAGASNNCNGNMILDFPVALNPQYSYSWSPATGLSSTTVANPRVTNVTANTTYTVTLTDLATGCSSQATASVNFTTVPAPTVTSATVNCSGTATLTASGGAPGSIYRWFTSAASSVDVHTGTSFTTPVLNATTSYWVGVWTNGCASSRTQTTVTVNPCSFTWTGATSTDWNVASNWSGNAVPSATSDVTIPAGLSRYPVISSGTATAKDLTIASGASLTINGGTLEVKEDFTNNGTFTATGGSATFSGSIVQVIGGTNPSTFHDLTISSAGASLAGPVSVQRVLTLNGNLATNGNTFTLLSNATGTAMVVNNGGVVNGTAKMQRYINPALNAGAGYRHFASPVTATTVSDFATAGFTPVVNPAYNTAVKPGTVRPFPNVLAYNQSRLNNDSARFQDFGFGWESPASLSSALTPGRGYSVNIAASRTVDFTGTLNNGTVTVTGLGRGATTESGWHLLGNPYPAPIDWDNITVPSGMMDAVYAFRSSSAYNGSYAAYVNGVGSLTGGVIPAMQAFFVRTTAPVASFSFTNAARLTSYQNPSFHRSTETRPLLQLSASKGQQQDEAFVYLEQGATAGMDNSFDAFSLPMGAVRVFTQAGTSPLSINGLGYSATPQLIPLVVEGTVGTYQLKVEQLLNQFQLQLEDKQLNTMQLLTPATIYSFSHAGGSTANRFVLHVGARISGVPETAKGMEVKLYPNPSNGKFQLQLSGLKASSAELIITDLTGKTILQKQVKANSGNITENIELKAAKGIYLLQIKADQQVITRKVIVE
ncbi:SBBP repeat-containing protein [Adhaeribacter soli]|uniref:T9SS type A sorting domain-containing protein n=1 Tax=Adhaeribacter soli TaxID=2607655 RepID=A0A5N1IH94_9BACT|nr:SBBP repeat-containing protein [Adhaeribacter soli]KAA9325025.1 T9SS type A sorting domain-containing protein [Adhaeribacter soli]